MEVGIIVTVMKGVKLLQMSCHDGKKLLRQSCLLILPHGLYHIIPLSLSYPAVGLTKKKYSWLVIAVIV